MAKRPRVPSKFTMQGKITEEHNEHVLVVSDLTLAMLVAGVEALLTYEYAALGKEEILQLKELSKTLRKGLEDTKDDRRQLWVVGGDKEEDA